MQQKNFTVKQAVKGSNVIIKYVWRLHQEALQLKSDKNYPLAAFRLILLIEEISKIHLILNATRTEGITKKPMSMSEFKKNFESRSLKLREIFGLIEALAILSKNPIATKERFKRTINKSPVLLNKLKQGSIYVHVGRKPVFKAPSQLIKATDVEALLSLASYLIKTFARNEVTEDFVYKFANRRR